LEVILQSAGQETQSSKIVALQYASPHAANNKNLINNYGFANSQIYKFTTLILNSKIFRMKDEKKEEKKEKKKRKNENKEIKRRKKEVKMNKER
jgi:hypothetical protein